MATRKLPKLQLPPLPPQSTVSRHTYQGGFQKGSRKEQRAQLLFPWWESGTSRHQSPQKFQLYCYNEKEIFFYRGVIRCCRGGMRGCALTYYLKAQICKAAHKSLDSRENSKNGQKMTRAPRSDPPRRHRRALLRRKRGRKKETTHTILIPPHGPFPSASSMFFCVNITLTKLYLTPGRCHGDAGWGFPPLALVSPSPLRAAVET